MNNEMRDGLYCDRRVTAEVLHRSTPTESNLYTGRGTILYLPGQGMPEYIH